MSGFENFPKPEESQAIPEPTPEQSAEIPSGKKGFLRRIRENIAGGPIREDLAKRATVNIGGKELNAGNVVYTVNRETGELIPWQIQMWEDNGVVLRAPDGGDAWRCAWDRVEGGDLKPEQ